LFQRDLTGSLTSLGKLTEMTKFDISANSIYGGIPQSFFSMPKLQHLYLNNNRLTGSIPPITSVNSQLLNLVLERNRLEGRIPESLSKMNGLHQVFLGQNRFTGTFPSLFGDMKSLITIECIMNRLTGTIPSNLNRLTKLNKVDLRSNLLTGTIPVLDQPSLQGINLSDNYLTMGSLAVVPLSTFSTSALAADIDLKLNCLVFRNPSKPSQDADATHCVGEQFTQNSCF
jgi:Leucine-rich repeat (LRR) protein